MDKANRDAIMQHIKKGRFISTNGKILRILNMIDIKERYLNSLCTVMQDVTMNDFRNSLLYLLESGYIRLDHPDGAACLETGPLDVPVGVEITGTGLELLMGIKDNPAVEV